MPDMNPKQEYDIGPITAEDDKGNPATFDGPIQATSSDPAIAECVVPHPTLGDQYVLVKNTDAIGAAQIRIFVDADMTPSEVREIEAFSSVNTVPREATVLKIVESPVRDQA